MVCVLRNRHPRDLAWANELTKKFRDELGAIHLGTLAAHAAIGHVVLAAERGENLGVLVSKPQLQHDPRIFPIIAAAVPLDIQRAHVGLCMLHALAATHKLGRDRIFQCKCRYDLPSNRFWYAAGFTAVAVQHSSSVRGKPTIIWRKWVDAPKLANGWRGKVPTDFPVDSRARMGGGRFLPINRPDLANILDFRPESIDAALAGRPVEVERPERPGDPQGNLFPPRPGYGRFCD